MCVCASVASNVRVYTDCSVPKHCEIEVKTNVKALILGAVSCNTENDSPARIW